MQKLKIVESVQIMVTVMVNPYETVLSLLPVIIVVAVVLGVGVMILLGLFLRGRLSLNIRAWGALTLTVASILFLSGLWCMFLSPTSTYPQTKDSFGNSISIEGLGTWSRSFSLKEGDSLAGSADTISEDPSAELLSFILRVRDPGNEVIWSDVNVKHRYFGLQASKTGVYTVEVRNPNEQTINCYLQVSSSTQVTYRVLESGGQWLTLVSLPVFGLGIWASGILGVGKKAAWKEEASDQ